MGEGVQDRGLVQVGLRGLGTRIAERGKSFMAYFLKVDGVNGGSIDDQHKGEFDVLSYEFDLSALMATSTSSGGGTGKTTISPLIVDLAATPGLADLITKLAQGQHIPTVTFAARKVGGSLFDYETIKLTNVTILGYEEKAGFATRVALGFDKIEVTLNEQKPDGSGVVAHEFAFDVAANGTLAPVGALEPVVPVTTTLDYFLKIDGVTGGATNEQHKGEFDILGYEFDLSALMATSTGTGGGSGKTTISPLIVDFELTPGLIELLKKAAGGQHIPSVTLTVLKPGAAPFTYETIKLTNVTILGYEEKADFATRVAFGYEKIELTLNEQKPDGSGVTPHVFAFDVAAGGTLAPV